MNNEPLEREPIDRVRARLEALLKANAAPRCGARSKRADRVFTNNREHSLVQLQSCPRRKHRLSNALHTNQLALEARIRDSSTRPRTRRGHRLLPLRYPEHISDLDTLSRSLDRAPMLKNAASPRPPTRSPDERSEIRGPAFRHSASLRAFTPVFDGLWTRVNALVAHAATGPLARSASSPRTASETPLTCGRAGDPSATSPGRRRPRSGCH